MSDLIRRGDVEEALQGLHVGDVRFFEKLRKALDEIPSAEPERKEGSFIGTEYDGYADGEPVYYEWKCSECGCVFEDDEPTYNFCPNCGADMRGDR